MTPRPVLRRRHRAAALALLTLTLVPGLAQLPALSAGAATPDAAPGVATPLGSLADPVAGLESYTCTNPGDPGVVGVNVPVKFTFAPLAMA